MIKPPDSNCDPDDSDTAPHSKSNNGNSNGKKYKANIKCKIQSSKPKDTIQRF